MPILDLPPDHPQIHRDVATLLVDGFRENWPEAWPHLEAGLLEVQASLQLGRISRIAINREEQVLGWIGGLPRYAGHVWELHPLVVKASERGQGWGRRLVADLETCVQQRGGLTLWVGTDDETGQTNLSHANLYPNVLEHLAQLKNLRQHPYEFYQKCGFSVVGVMPDANGRGKPDIYMAKSITPKP
ncbi:N-acetyltransferase [Acaryochloris sp. CCMEE 5410]|uniref:GNAT family N-acetyltransferase n=1 Tax=Acaryochloris sp. CCMEE 5410 TaxID=310037 RepID=UPI0002483BBF|nr:GNAT family N-acetyltransferase [Acaryochloris sp. CCMEE 5410]KAI9133519.1 GNAT family N-acetyltransferase [Acaryochloris sp. CCMEE 5410]